MIAIVTLSAFWLIYRGEEANVERARTVAFGVAAFTQLFFSFGCRSNTRTMQELTLFSNPWLLGAVMASVILQISVMLIPVAQRIFDVSSGLTWEWALIGVCTIIPVTMIEVAKLLKAAFASKIPAPGHL